MAYPPTKTQVALVLWLPSSIWIRFLWVKKIGPKNPAHLSGPCSSQHEGGKQQTLPSLPKDDVPITMEFTDVYGKRQKNVSRIFNKNEGFDSVYTLED